MIQLTSHAISRRSTPFGALLALVAGALVSVPAAASLVPPVAAQVQGPATVRDRATSGSIARGVVRATAEATLSARISARIVELPYAEGTEFARGATLAAFDCERPLAEARAAAAALNAQRKQVETNEELDRFNAIGKNDLQVSRAQLDRSQAESDALASQTKACAITAPFRGRVLARLARQHEFVQTGTPLLKIVDTSSTEVDIIVPSHWLSWLGPGTRFEFRIDETRGVLPAKVVRLLPSVDPVSRTIRIVATFTTPDARVLPGMSGTASGWSGAK